jgi:hypothetical protein
MFDSPGFWQIMLIVLAVLTLYLCFSMEKRRRAEKARWLAREKEEREKWQARLEYTPGVSLDVSAIAPRIEQLREDHLAALHTRPHEAYYRRGLIAAVRQMVTSLAYFHRVRPENEVPKHDVAQP